MQRRLVEEPKREGRVHFGQVCSTGTQGRLPQSLHVSPKDRAAGVSAKRLQVSHCSWPWRPAAAERTRPWTAAGRSASLFGRQPEHCKCRGCHSGTRTGTFLQPRMRGRGSSALTSLLSGCHAPRVPRLRDSGRDGAKRGAPGEQPNQNRAGSPVPARPRPWLGRLGSEQGLMLAATGLTSPTG